MPLEVRIDVVPHGVEEARQQIDSVRITQVERFDDDPDGLRAYAVQHGQRLIHVTHRRGDGAMKLVTMALMALTALGGVD